MLFVLVLCAQLTEDTFTNVGNNATTVGCVLLRDMIRVYESFPKFVFEKDT